MCPPNGGDFYRLEGVGHALFEENSCHKYIECIINRRRGIAFRDLVFNPLGRHMQKAIPLQANRILTIEIDR